MQNHNGTLLILRMEGSFRLNFIAPSKVINSYGNANECDDMCPVREEVRRHRLIHALAHAITINEKLAEVCSQGQVLVLFGWENNWC